MSQQKLTETVSAIQPVSAEALAQAEARQGRLTKPAGSLGLLEKVGIRLAGIAGECPPPMPVGGVVGVFAGDHGVCAQGVTPWPQEVTVSMLLNMAAGGAAINVLSRQMGVGVMLTDVGVLADYPETEGVRARRVARGTRDLSVEPAMTRDEALQALAVGIDAADEAVAGGARVLLTGEMGIGNTTPSSALIAVFTGADASVVTGSGAGVDSEALARKVRAIEKALALHTPDAGDPVGVLAAVGGLEQAAIAGFILGAARHRVPVILDGVIACASACVAVALAPESRGYLIAGHAGTEPGITEALRHLDLDPLVDLGLRLGEGTGAVLALPMVAASAAILREMATFEEVGIDA